MSFSRCQCIKLDENQCTRSITSKGSKYCWQHQKCKRPIKIVKPKKLPSLFSESIEKELKEIEKSLKKVKLKKVSSTRRRLAAKLPSKPSFIHTPSPKKIKDMPRDMLFEIALQMDVKDILNLCKTSKQFAEICKNDYLWFKLLERDYPQKDASQYTKIKNKTNRELYDLHELLEWINKYNKEQIKNVDDLINLKELDLEHNLLEEIPKKLGQLTNLEDINLSYNQLVMPKELGQLGQLTNLIYLDIGYNDLKKIPKEFGQLTNLKELHIGNNDLKKIPKELGQLTNLKELSLNHNYLKEIPKELGQLTNLKILDLYSNVITSFNDLPKEVQELGEDIIIFE